jgi:carbon monoxide dehydrogenase subunit G
MKAIERTISVSTPLTEVWAYLSDFTNTESWDPPTQSTVRVSGTGGTGTVYRNVSRLMGREVEVEYTVVQCEPERLLQLRGEANAMRMLDTMTFEGGPTGTTVTYRAEFEPQGAAKLAEPLLPLGLKRLGDESEDQLERMLTQLPNAGPGSS